MKKILQLIAVLAALSNFLAAPALAQQAGPSAAPTSTIETRALPSLASAPAFDAQKSTNAYLRQVSGAARERSDAYFEGGYVLLFVDAFYVIAVSAHPALVQDIRTDARLRKGANPFALLASADLRRVVHPAHGGHVVAADDL